MAMSPTHSIIDQESGLSERLYSDSWNGRHDSRGSTMEWVGDIRPTRSVLFLVEASPSVSSLVGRISPVAPGTLGIVPLQGRGIVGKLLK